MRGVRRERGDAPNIPPALLTTSRKMLRGVTVTSKNSGLSARCTPCDVLLCRVGHGDGGFDSSVWVLNHSCRLFAAGNFEDDHELFSVWT